MEAESNEVLDVFSEDGEVLGQATRDEVHRQGLWHHTFQIWLVENGSDEAWVWFQRRSPVKAQYADLWDITVAGHLLSGEGPRDGFRELQEELGIDIDPMQADYFGIVRDEILTPDQVDREHCHIFFAMAPCGLDGLTWDTHEVADMGRVRLSHAAALVQGREGTMTIATSNARFVVDKGMLVPHTSTYYHTVFDGLRQYCESR